MEIGIQKLHHPQKEVIEGMVIMKE